MDRLLRERDDDAVRREPEPPAPAAVQAGSLAWASAIGNQAVQRLARQEAEPEAAEMPESEAEDVPDEVGALTSAGIGIDDAADLAAVDDLAEDDLPD